MGHKNKGDKPKLEPTPDASESANETATAEPGVFVAPLEGALVEPGAPSEGAEEVTVEVHVHPGDYTPEGLAKAVQELTEPSPAATVPELLAAGTLNVYQAACLSFDLESADVLSCRTITPTTCVLVTKGGRKLRYPEDVGAQLSDMEKGGSWKPPAQPSIGIAAGK